MDPGFPFNSDLLVSENDQAQARRLYPNVFFALDDAELRKVFEPLDTAANAAKTRSRTLGMLAVFLVLFGLVVGSTEPLYSKLLDGLWSETIDIVSAIAGIGGGLIGGFGVMFGESKNRWLEKRYLTERLRQLHFQTLLARAASILKAADGEDKSGFFGARAEDLARFRMERLEPVAAMLGAIVEDLSPEGAWIFRQPADPPPPDAKHLDEFLTALAHLRIAHQLNFTKLKLRTSGLSLLAAPRRQVAVFSSTALWCVAAVLVLHMWLLLAGFHSTSVASAKNGGVFETVLILAPALALVALAARALEDGFQSRAEVERYRQYGSALQLVHDRFEATDDPLAKLRTLFELEELSFEEMCNFLKSYHEARFVM
jgi:hypothetical protein